ncbi:ComEA family DNA-binding protein [Neomicrococcus lactis]|uniref:ComEA family DNA-binding protein n=1 Tax=Neomicrococcus lactis TaxID=732241 RepID=UPI0030B86731
MTVSVQGSVKHPGLYTVASGERWGMVLTKAGGVLKDADIRSINLAEQAQDGQQLYVPKVNETVAPAAAPTTGSPAHVPGAPAAADATVGATRQVTSTVVNINLATAAELEALPGVGPALSQRIVEFREQNGPFKSAAELDAVSGIGPAMLKKLEGLIGF